jgi:hypothetical protein
MTGLSTSGSAIAPPRRSRGRIVARGSSLAPLRSQRDDLAVIVSVRRSVTAEHDGGSRTRIGGVISRRRIHPAATSHGIHEFDRAANVAAR